MRKQVVSAICVSLLFCSIPVSVGQDSKSPSNEHYIYGYVHDNTTGLPLAGVNVTCWNSWDIYSTMTNQSGFYSIATLFVQTFTLSFTLPNYFSEWTTEQSFGDNDEFWYNQSLLHYPSATVLFCGYVTDNKTGAPLDDAWVEVYWNDTYHHYWNAEMNTEEDGFYSILAIPGQTHIIASSQNYHRYHSPNLITNENSTIWLNVSLDLFEACAWIVGTVKDNQTGAPIQDAYVDGSCFTDDGFWDNFTKTNADGWFKLGIIPNVTDVDIWKANYSFFHQEISIVKNETLSLDVGLSYDPETRARIYGYITDNVTSAIIPNVTVTATWKDNLGHQISYNTFADERGYYHLDVPDGESRINVTTRGYKDGQSSWVTVQEHYPQEIDLRLDPIITLEIVAPKPGFYLGYHWSPLLSRITLRLFPFLTSIVINSVLVIKSNVTNTAEGLDRVEYFIDNQWVETHYYNESEYIWDVPSHGIHVIRVVAYDNIGTCAIQTLYIYKLL